MYRIIWQTVYEDYNYRNSVVQDQRPSEVDADRYEINNGPEGSYIVHLNFFKGEQPVAAFFQLPTAIIAVADVQE